jgi:SAM-dependent methyltransferase
MSHKQPDVHAAYALKTPEDSQRLYADWADTYDRSFAEDKKYLMPRHVARLFAQHGGGGPVFDAGAGTGLVAEAIVAHGPCAIDGFDITPEMLEVAKGKGVYRRTIQGDLTRPLPFADDTYAAVVSAGTFTHGHVGPEALDEPLRIARPGALFILTIKKDHFIERGFAEKFDELSAQITAFETVVLPIYDDVPENRPRDDQGLMAIFRKA